MNNSKSVLKPLLTSVLLLAITVVAIIVIFSTEPKAQKDGATKRTPMLVDTITARVEDNTPTIRAYGVVVPSQTIDLKPRVSGEVVAIASNFVPGNFLKQGEWLVQLDPADYQLALQRAEAELTKAESAYQIELGEQIRARKAFELVSGRVSEANKALVLREPQMKQVEATLKTAKAMLAQAQLELDRTLIKMPFDGQILSRSANLGSQLSANDTLAEIIGTESYWIESNLPLSQLAWLSSPSANEQSADVIIRNNTAWQDQHSMQGKLIQIISTLDQESRMARVLVEVNDPLGLKSSDAQISNNPLIAGTYVETVLPAKTIRNSVRLPVAYLRKQDTVWVKKDDMLDIRQVKVAFRDQNYGYITEGLEQGDQIITTDISTVRQGASVQLKSDTNTTEKAE